MIILLGLMILPISACEDLLEKKPDTSGARIPADQLVENRDDLQELLNSAYDVLGNTYNGNLQNLFNCLNDNLVRPVQQDDLTSVWLRSTSIFNGSMSNVFNNIYFTVFRCNTVFDEVDNVSLSNEERNRFLGEASFLRALAHFEAVRGWAQPHGYTPNNSHPGVAIQLENTVDNTPRSTVQQVYDQILSDIATAKELLPEMNPEGSAYANKWAAIALEAEVRFQMHQYDLAYQLANEVITMGPYSLNVDVNKYQHPEPGAESIFYIFSATLDNGTIDNRAGGFRGNYFPLENPSLRLQPELYDKMVEFATEPDTLRAGLYQILDNDGNISYITTMFEEEFFNIPVFTLTQMHLIRAESAGELNSNLNQAVQDVNAIRTRAWGSVVANLPEGASAEDIIEAARLERRLEFPFTGQRTHDLKRIGTQGEEVIIRDAVWDCNGMVLQFPATEGTAVFELNPTGGC